MASITVVSPCGRPGWKCTTIPTVNEILAPKMSRIITSRPN